jgi:hypothetical protein
MHHVRRAVGAVLALHVACASAAVPTKAAASSIAEIAFAFGVLAALASIALALLAGGLKIAILRRFQLDAAWSQYGARQAWRESRVLVAGRLLRQSYAIISWLSLAALCLALLLLAPTILGR